MRQVPNYLIIGNGKMATHFCHYLTLLELPFTQWARQHHTLSDLKRQTKKASHILFLISDAAIVPFFEEHAIGNNKINVHFSGQLCAPGIHSAHPLMTFTQDLYDKQSYSQTPFILIKDGPDFSELLPHLPNPSYTISPEHKTFYHALCVIGNNFTCLLWKKLFDEFTQTLQLPQSAAMPYLMQTFKNIQKNPQSALTGPLVRKDRNTIQAHLEVLQDDNFLEIYQSFVRFFAQAGDNS